MVDWHCFSSTDLEHWEDHGVIFSLDDIAWAERNAYAPDCMKRDGKYYLYFTADYNIGVAVSDSPSGPFKDALGEPLVRNGEGGTLAMDPCVFVDDDGQAYLYYGQFKLCVVKLKGNMVEKDGDVVALDVHRYCEGIWVHKHNGLYYFSYASALGDKVANLLEYSAAKSPLGPFDYKGIIIDNRSRNVQHSIVRFRSQWYLFYHVEGPSPYERRVCAEYLYYSDDGTIQPIEMTKEGVVLRNAKHDAQVHGGKT